MSPVPDTSLGITYPSSSSHDRIWEHIQAVADDVNALFLAAPGAWTDYTPTWSSTGTAPAYGNATILGRYIRPANSKLVIYRVRILFGSTTTFGTGTWSFSLPVTAGTSGLDPYSLGSAYFRDTSAASVGHYPGVCQIDATGGPNSIGCITGANTQASNAQPFTWANTDHISFQIAYEAA